MLDLATLDTLYDLTARTLYSAEVKQLPILSDEEEQAVIRQAREGDASASAELIHSCLRFAFNEAWNLYETRQPRHDDLLAFVQMASLMLVEKLPKALAKENPASYLRATIRRHLSVYCTYYSPLIHLPQERAADLATMVIPAVVVSLDALVPPLLDVLQLPMEIIDIGMPPEERSEVAEREQRLRQQRLALLYETIETLTPRQREMIVRAYGLYDTIAETNAELGVTGERCKRLAIANLRKKLSARLPQLLHLTEEG